MSVNRLGTRVLERAVLGADGGEVGVRRTNGNVQITWFCGATRTFTPDGLRNAIAHVELLSDHPDVVVELRDSYGHRVYARVDQDTLLADERPDVEGARAIPWSTLRKTMKKAAD